MSVHTLPNPGGEFPLRRAPQCLFTGGMLNGYSCFAPKTPVLEEQSTLLILCQRKSVKEKGAWGRAKLILPGKGIRARTKREFPDLCAICDVWDIAKMLSLLQHIFPVDALV